MTELILEWLLFILLVIVTLPPKIAIAPKNSNVI